MLLAGLFIKRARLQNLEAERALPHGLAFFNRQHHAVERLLAHPASHSQTHQISHLNTSILVPDPINFDTFAHQF